MWPYRPPPAPSASSVYSEMSDPRARRPHRPFSGFFNGVSVVGSQRNGVHRSGSKPPSNRTSRRFSPLRLSHLNLSLPALRSPSSTRSVIDPSTTPSTSGRGMSTVSFISVNPLTSPVRARVLDYGGNMPISMDPALQREMSRSSRPSPSDRQRRRRQGPRWVPRHSKGKVWFSAMESSAVRTKVFHSIVSGAILAIVLIVCTFILRIHVVRLLTTHSSRPLECDFGAKSRIPHRGHSLRAHLQHPLPPLIHPYDPSDLSVQEGRSRGRRSSTWVWRLCVHISPYPGYTCSRRGDGD